MIGLKLIDRRKFIISTSATVFMTIGVALGAQALKDGLSNYLPLIQYAYLVVSAPPTILLLIARFAGKATVLRFIESEIGLRISDDIKETRVVFYGVGGSGKSTLMAAHFKNDLGQQPRTTILREHEALVTHKSQTRRLLFIDYEGQREETLRNKLRELHIQNSPIHALCLIVSFFDVTKEKPIIPTSTKERKLELERHLKFQMDEIAPPVIRELLRACPGLHSVFLIINQIDVLDQINEIATTPGSHANQIRFANQHFGDLISRVQECVDAAKSQDEGRNIKFTISYVSATKRTEIRPDENFEVQGIRIGVSILERQEQVYG